MIKMPKSGNWAKVKGWSDYLVSDNGEIWSIRRGRERKVWSVPGKYPRVTLAKNGIEKTLSVHRLVAVAFITNPLNKRTINHIDGNKQNNHVTNLEWNTMSENMVHAVEIGLVKPPVLGNGETHKAAKLSNVDVQMIRVLLNAKDFTLKQIAKRFGICDGHVSDIKYGKTRQHG